MMEKDGDMRHEKKGDEKYLIGKETKAGQKQLDCSGTPIDKVF